MNNKGGVIAIEKCYTIILNYYNIHTFRMCYEIVEDKCETGFASFAKPAQ